MTLRELQAASPCDCTFCPCCVPVELPHEVCGECSAGRRCDVETGERRVLGRRFGSVRQGRSER